MVFAVAAALAEAVLSPEVALTGDAVTASWWTVMFPGLSELPGPGDAATDTPELRWWIVELLRAVFGR